MKDAFLLVTLCLVLISGIALVGDTMSLFTFDAPPPLVPPILALLATCLALAAHWAIHRLFERPRQ